MIRQSELYPIGYVAKTHGIKGELNVGLDTVFDPEDFKFLVFDIDNIFVPFQVENSRGQGQNNRLVTLKGINTVEDAKPLTGKTVYVLQRELKEHPDYEEVIGDEGNGIYLSDLVGYTVKDADGKTLGEVSAFNDDTQNFLLEITIAGGKKTYIPYVDEWVTEFNPDNKTIAFDLPDGLI